MGGFAGSAPAKIILLGEHFVVHGAPALAMPLPDLRLRATLQPGENAPPVTGHLAACLDLCRESFGGPAPGALACHVDSDIPQRIGLGSSAALAVALAQAWAAMRGMDRSGVLDTADRCERVAHGRPSGIDTRAVLAPGPLRFQAQLGTRPLRVAPGFGVVVINVGERASTAELVNSVRGRVASHPERFRQGLAELRGLVEVAARALAVGDVPLLGETLRRNQVLLRQIGVSTPEVEAGVTALERAGAAGAKLTGAGRGGAVIGLTTASEAHGVAERVVARGHSVVAVSTKWEATCTAHR